MNCYACGAAILDTDDAMVCVECGGRNVRSVRPSRWHYTGALAVVAILIWSAFL